MCDPIQIAVAQAGANLVQQRQAASLQRRAQARQSAAESQRFQMSMTAQRLNEQQQAVAAAKETQEILRKGQEAQATARVSAGESGVMGTAVENLLSDLQAQETRARFAIEQQQQFRGVASWLDTQGKSFASQQQQIGINKPIESVDLLGEAINLTGDIFSIKREDELYKLKKKQLGEG